MPWWSTAAAKDGYLENNTSGQTGPERSTWSGSMGSRVKVRLVFQVIAQRAAQEQRRLSRPESPCDPRGVFGIAPLIFHLMQATRPGSQPTPGGCQTLVYSKTGGAAGVTSAASPSPCSATKSAGPRAHARHAPSHTHTPTLAQEEPSARDQHGDRTPPPWSPHMGADDHSLSTAQVPTLKEPPLNRSFTRPTYSNTEKRPGMFEVWSTLDVARLTPVRVRNPCHVQCATAAATPADGPGPRGLGEER